jgi:hypothetical protein
MLSMGRTSAGVTVEGEHRANGQSRQGPWRGLQRLGLLGGWRKVMGDVLEVNPAIGIGNFRAVVLVQLGDLVDGVFL